MGMFDSIVAASATGSGNWIKDGSYLLVITKCLYEKKFNGWTWITEFTVLESKPNIGELEIGGKPCRAGTAGATQVEPNMPGTSVSFTIPTEKLENGPGNVKAFMLALMDETEAGFNAAEKEALKKRALEEAQGIPEDKRTPKPSDTAYMAVTGDRQLARGMLIRCDTTRKLNKGLKNKANEGNVLVLPTWKHVAPVAAEVAFRRALIEAGQPVPWPMVMPGTTA